MFENVIKYECPLLHLQMQLNCDIQLISETGHENLSLRKAFEQHSIYLYFYDIFWFISTST